MAIIKCKMCGGNLTLTEGQSVAECEYCGSRQTVPAADNEKKLNLFASANKLRSACEFDRAMGVYDSIRAEFPDEAEAYWGLVLCKYGIEYVDDPATGKKVPTCHRSSYDSIIEDSDFEQALENADAVARKVYLQEGKQLEQIRKDILAVSSKEEPYDIFICYKEKDENGDRTLDSQLAQQIYMALTDRGYRVFFARVTLKSALGAAYEPIIFAALNSAKVMLAIGTCYEYFNAVWVKNEWSRYLKLCAQSKDKHLIPCFRDIDAYDMPKEFRPLQAVDLSQMGAIQDIVLNMDKYIPLKKNTTVIQEKVVVGGSGGNKIASLLDRGNMALEDGDWAKADSFFEDVLNNDSKNAQAYLGKTLAQEKCRTIDAFARKRKKATERTQIQKLRLEPNQAHVDEMVHKFSLPGYVDQREIRKLYDFDLTYTSEAAERKHQHRDEVNFWANHKLLSRAEKFAVGAVAENLEREKKALLADLAERVKQAEKAEAAAKQDVQTRYEAHLKQADEKAEKLYNDGVKRREAYYQSLLQTAKTSSNVAELTKTARKFDALGSYQDSKNLAEHCRKRADEEQAKIDAEAERQRLIKEKQEKERKAKNKRNGILAAIAAVVVIAVIIVMTTVVIPGNRYSAAEALLAEGRTAEAAMAFSGLGNFRDSRDRGNELWEEAAVRDSIAAGYWHTVGLKNDGTVIAVGESNYGRLNVSSWTDMVAVAAGSSHTVGLKADGTVMATGINADGQCDVGGWTDIVAIAAGSYHTVGLKSDGTMLAVGSSFNGRTNMSSFRNIVAIAAGADHTVGLKADGTVTAIGLNESGQCQVFDWTDIVAIAAGAHHTVGLKADGTVVSTTYTGEDRFNYGQDKVSDWTDIVAIAAGAYHTVGLKADGTVVAVGDWEDGQCEVNNWRNVVAIAAGGSHTLGIQADGTVLVCGTNTDNQCEVQDWTDMKLPPINPEEQAAREAFVQAEQAARYAEAQQLEASGETIKAAMTYGSAGDYMDARTKSMELWATIAVRNTIAAGDSHTVGLKTDGTVIATKYTGDQKYYHGECDVDTWTDIISVAVGSSYTVGLKADGTVVIASDKYEGLYNVSNWTDIVAIAGGEYHAVGLRSDGTVVAVGSNGDGECNVSGWTDIVAISAGGSHTVGLKADGTVVATKYTGNQKYYYGECEVSDWTDIVAISAGYDHTLGLKADGTVVAIGNYGDGQCNVSGWTDIVAISAGGNHSIGLKADGTVVSVGDSHGGRRDVEGWTDIISIASAWYHTVGLKADGTVVATEYTGSKDIYDGQCEVSDWTDIKTYE